MSEIADNKKKANRFKVFFREGIAIFFWIYLILKLFVFDLDTYLIDNYVPSLHPVLDYKFLIFLCLIIIAWSIIKDFPIFILYVFGYPAVVMCWKIPMLLLRNGSLAIALTPPIYKIITTFRLYFFSSALAIIAAACILVSTNKISLIISMIVLFILLLMHLFLSLQQAYKPTVFSKMSQRLSNFRVKLEEISFLKNIIERNGTIDEISSDSDDSSDNILTRQLSIFYMIHCGFEVLNVKIREVFKSRTIDFYLMFSWFTTLFVTAIIFSLEYQALFKMNPKSFSIPFEPNYFSFLGFSFGSLATANISKIVPEDIYANGIYYAELSSSIVILVILIFSILTAARERYVEEIEGIIKEFSEIDTIFQQGSQQIFNLALADLEQALMDHDHKFVNAIRTIRGLPKLPTPSDNIEKPDSELNQKWPTP